MQQLLHSEVKFPKACVMDPESFNGPLLQKLFHLSSTAGVEKDIPQASKDKNHLHVFSVASQYNCSEAPSPFTPKVGHAMETSEADKTQGPLAQRTNPLAFELVTAFLTHLGFNMLHEALPLAGKTFEDSCIKHGYLRPTNQNVLSLTEEFKKNFSKSEYVCYTSLSEEWGGSEFVHIFLQAAPAIGYSPDLNVLLAEELTKYSALANYLALFQYGITLAEQEKKLVILHITAVGGGVFANSVSSLCWGFEKAALFFQDQMQAANVSVQLEAFGGKGHLADIANQLRIDKKL